MENEENRRDEEEQRRRWREIYGDMVPERIVDTKIGEDGKRYYKVQWATSNFEPAKNFLEAEMLIDKYWDPIEKKLKLPQRQKGEGRTKKTDEGGCSSSSEASSSNYTEPNEVTNQQEKAKESNDETKQTNEETKQTNEETEITESNKNENDKETTSAHETDNSSPDKISNDDDDKKDNINTDNNPSSDPLDKTNDRKHKLDRKEDDNIKDNEERILEDQDECRPSKKSKID